MAVPCRGARRHHEPAQHETTVDGQSSERGLPARGPRRTCPSLGSLAVSGRHHALTDAQWERIAPLSPSSAGKWGRPWSDHRRVIDAIVYRYRTCIPWRDLPTEFGSRKTAWARHGKHACRHGALGLHRQTACGRRSGRRGSRTVGHVPLTVAPVAGRGFPCADVTRSEAA
ncbi:transposase [Streptomyces sp. NPDC002809]|uniref:transposase n=1 Tax=Streptomyces sp. NPDC002809 TaxID=3154433 RepID=UPI00332012B9